MSRRRSKQSASEIGDVRFALKCAKQFFHGSREIFEKQVGTLSSIGDEPNVLKSDEGIVFLETNLIFSCELYLKFMIMLQGNRPLSDHNLWKLYNSINLNNRNYIEYYYNAKIKEEKDAGRLMYGLNLVVGYEGNIGLEKAIEISREASPNFSREAGASGP